MENDQYTLGDRVIATRQIYQEPDGDSPGGELAACGDVLEVRKIRPTFPHGTFPISVAHPHREPSAMFGVKLNEIRPAQPGSDHMNHAPPPDTPIPHALYSCATDHCAEERTWPAEDLVWVPDRKGFYCTYCLDDFDERPETGITVPRRERDGRPGPAGESGVAGLQRWAASQDGT